LIRKIPKRGRLVFSGHTTDDDRAERARFGNLGWGFLLRLIHPAVINHFYGHSDNGIGRQTFHAAGGDLVGFVLDFPTVLPPHPGSPSSRRAFEWFDFIILVVNGSHFQCFRLDMTALLLAQKLTKHLQTEALRLLDEGEPQAAVARLLGVDQSTISRLAARVAA
jgi:Helix-turn-helix domain